MKKNPSMSYSTQGKKIDTYSNSLAINECTLEGDSCIKYLGIFIDSHLTWKCHVDYISRKV